MAGVALGKNYDARFTKQWWLSTLISASLILLLIFFKMYSLNFLFFIAGICVILLTIVLLYIVRKTSVSFSKRSIFKINTTDNIKTFFQVLFGIFILWMIFGGMFEKENNSNSVYIDCAKESYKNSQYCNGEYESKMQEQNYNDNNYYQNTVR
jgi:hypothetical protein